MAHEQRAASVRRLASEFGASVEMHATLETLAGSELTGMRRVGELRASVRGIKVVGGRRADAGGRWGSIEISVLAFLASGRFVCACIDMAGRAVTFLVGLSACKLLLVTK